MWWKVTSTNAWVLLIIAGLCEMLWVIGMKYSDGFSRLWPSLLTGLAMLLSFVFLSQAIKHIPIGIAYSVWTGIGAVGTVLFGMMWLKEPITVVRLLFIFLIVTGVIGLKMVGSSGQSG